MLSAICNTGRLKMQLREIGTGIFQTASVFTPKSEMRQQ